MSFLIDRRLHVQVRHSRKVALSDLFAIFRADEGVSTVLSNHFHDFTLQDMTTTHPHLRDSFDLPMIRHGGWEDNA